MVQGKGKLQVQLVVSNADRGVCNSGMEEVAR